MHKFDSYSDAELRKYLSKIQEDISEHRKRYSYLPENPLKDAYELKLAIKIKGNTIENLIERVFQEEQQQSDLIDKTEHELISLGELNKKSAECKQRSAFFENEIKRLESERGKLLKQEEQNQQGVNGAFYALFALYDDLVRELSKRQKKIFSSKYDFNSIDDVTTIEDITFPMSTKSDGPSDKPLTMAATNQVKTPFGMTAVPLNHIDSLDKNRDWLQKFCVKHNFEYKKNKDNIELKSKTNNEKILITSNSVAMSYKGSSDTKNLFPILMELYLQSCGDKVVIDHVISGPDAATINSLSEELARQLKLANKTETLINGKNLEDYSVVQRHGHS